MQQGGFPVEFVARIHELFPVRASEILRALETGRPTTFRVNTLKIRREEALHTLHQAGFECESGELDNAFILKNKTIRELEEQSLYQQGALYVQGLSSMIPPLLLDPKPGESVLDCAAAPGSKTTQMAALMKNEGMILANDTSRVRLYKLKANLEKLGVSNVQIRHGLAQHIWRDFPEVFDKVLVDVPCSMEGRIRADRPQTYEEWSVRKIKDLAERQKFMLLSACSAARVGARIVYSTCTMAPEENEGVVAWLLKKTKGAVSLESPSPICTEWSSGIVEWQGTQYPPELAQTVRIMPDSRYEGFYVAVLRKDRTLMK